MSFDPMEHLSDLLSSVGLKAEDGGGTVEIVGTDPIIPGRHRLGAMSSIALMGNAVAVAALWRMRTGRGQDLRVDMRRSIFMVGDNSFGIDAYHDTINGGRFALDRSWRHPIRAITDFHELRDGRWGSLSAHYEHMLFTWLKLLKSSPDPEDVSAALRTWRAEDLEEATAELGLAYATVRSREEWAENPQGRAQLGTPVSDLRKIGESAPEPLGPSSRPLAGMKVLGCTHAIAGSIVGRALAEQGADVLWLHSPNQTEYETVYNSANVGTRSTLVDLKTPEGSAKARELLASADVFVENLRGGAMARLGLSDEEIMEIRPGIIIATLRCFGDNGPWGIRAGHDRQGTAASGVAASEGGGVDRPKLPGTRTTNDYMAGYQAAMGVTAALIRRATEGGSYHVGSSLVRNAMWLESLGLLEEEEGKAEGWQSRLLPPIEVTAETPLGELRRIAPPVEMSETPGYWSNPILVPRGSSRAEWLGGRG